MGGLHSRCYVSTTRVLLESAHFDGLRVRRGARALGLSTEASRRFERWVDPNGVRRAADRAAQLLHEHAGGTVVSVFADRYLQPITPLTVRLRSARCNAVLGLRLTTEVIGKSLERLGLSVIMVEEGVLDVTIPTFRRDISREIDLIEEVARVYGYEQIPTTLPKTVNPMAGRSLSKRLEERAKSALLRCGLTEVITFSMENIADVERSGIATAPVVKFANPISEDYTQMRTSLVPSLLGVLGKNARSGARVFELGKVYLPQEGEQLPKECRHLGMALLQPAAQQAHWQKNATTPADDFFSLKAVVETTLSELGVPPLLWRAAIEAPFHPGRCARLSIDSQDVGVLGEVHPDVAARYDLAGRAVIGVLDFDPLVRHIALLKQYQPLVRFPAIERDLALVLRAEQPAAMVEGVLRAAGGELLRSVRTFDVYTGAPVPEGSKSMALSLLFRAEDRTLTDTEIEVLMSQIRSAAEQELGATLR
jgi:phenylalanyl-tRNA synthetase beta chain